MRAFVDNLKSLLPRIVSKFQIPRQSVCHSAGDKDLLTSQLSGFLASVPSCRVLCQRVILFGKILILNPSRLPSGITYHYSV